VKRRSLLIFVPFLLLACDFARRAAAPEDRLERQRTGYSAYNATALMVVTGDSASSTRFKPGAAANMVIRSAAASVKVDSLEPAVAALRQLAARLGGFVANAGIQTGEGELRSAMLELKVPAPRFDEAVAGLKPIGKLDSVRVDAQDVGEEYVDVTARMENARRLERRLIDLLASRTGKLKDVLDVEQSLARVREEIERYEGRIRYLQAHTAVSTLAVYVHEPLPVVGTAGQSVMGEAFRQAWRNFITMLAVLVQALGVLLPLGAVAAAGWIVYRRWPRSTSQTAPAAAE